MGEVLKGVSWDGKCGEYSVRSDSRTTLSPVDPGPTLESGWGEKHCRVGENYVLGPRRKDVLKYTGLCEIMRDYGLKYTL